MEKKPHIYSLVVQGCQDDAGYVSTRAPTKSSVVSCMSLLTATRSNWESAYCPIRQHRKTLCAADMEKFFGPCVRSMVREMLDARGTSAASVRGMWLCGVLVHMLHLEQEMSKSCADESSRKTATASSCMRPNHIGGLDLIHCFMIGPDLGRELTKEEISRCTTAWWGSEKLRLRTSGHCTNCQKGGKTLKNRASSDREAS